MRKKSVSDTTLKTRKKQWKCYVKICKKFGWSKYSCDSAQACKYLAYLSSKIKYSSVINYQTVIFYHNVKGCIVAGWSDSLVSQTMKHIKNSQCANEDVKDPLDLKKLGSMYRQADTKSHMGLLVWAMVFFLFSTLLMSPPPLSRRDIKVFKWGVLVSIRSSKTKKAGKPTKNPISYGRDKFSCPVYWLDKLFRRYPRNKNDYLFSTIKVQSISYSMFNTALKSLIAKAGIKGNFATHSLRRGGTGTTSLHHKGAPLPYLRERGQWASDCIYKYIKPSIISKINKNDIMTLNDHIMLGEGRTRKQCNGNGDRYTGEYPGPHTL